ncbi:MAG TPA: hypothetical protein VF808_20075 [Ktedonobacterales bacterium]
MRVHWRGNGHYAIIMALACALGLAACSSGRSSTARADMTATTGPVTVATNLSAFTISDAIGVTVTNSSSTDYYAISDKSACVIIQLERYNTLKNVWEPVDACATPGTTQAFVIAKNAQQQFTLAPGSAGDPNAWQPGLYRVTLIFSPNADGASNPQEAHCAAFNVK